MGKYQAYPEYKDSGTNWLGETPAHWQILPTKRFFRLVAEPAPCNNNLELLSVYTEIGVKPRKELEQKGNKASTTDGYWLVNQGDIVVNKLLAWMGAVGHSNYDGVTSPAYDILRKTKDFNSRFYHYLFRSDIAKQEFKRWSRGIMEVRLRLYFDELGRISMPFPPKEEIEAITNFLDHETAKIDTLIEKQQQLIKLLKEKHQAVISHAVTKGLNLDVPMKDSGVEWLGDVPEHWVLSQAKHVFRLQRGHDLSSGQFKEGNIPVYGSNGIIGYHNEATTSGPCITVGRSGSVGKVNFIPCDFWAHNTSLYLKWLCNSGSMDYIFYLLLAMDVESLSAGSAVGTLDRNNIHKQIIALPTNSEQLEIVEHIREMESKFDLLLDKSQKSIRLMQERRTALISAAVTGKIDVRNWKKPEESEQGVA